MDVLRPEAIVVVVIVDGLDQGLRGRVARVRVRLQVEVCHDLLHFRLYLILSNAKLGLHDLGGFLLTAVFVEAARERLHCCALTLDLLIIVDALGNRGRSILKLHELLLFRVSS